MIRLVLIINNFENRVILMKKKEKKQRNFIVKKKNLFALISTHVDKAYIKIQRKNLN